MDQELMVTIARVKRATTNPDVLAVCEALEGLLVRAVAAVPAKKDSPWRNPETGKFDKRAWQREYMRKYRKSANPFG